MHCVHIIVGSRDPKRCYGALTNCHLIVNLHDDDLKHVRRSTREKLVEGLSYCCFHEHCCKLFLIQAEQLELAKKSFLLFLTFLLSVFGIYLLHSIDGNVLQYVICILNAMYNFILTLNNSYSLCFI